MAAPIVIDLNTHTVSSNGTPAIDLGSSRRTQVVLTNGRILGGTSEQSALTTYSNLTYDGAGLTLGPESNSTVLDSQFLHGATIWASEAFLHVEGNQFSSNGTGTAILASVSTATLIGNTITGYDTGIEFRWGGADKVDIRGNTIQNSRIGIEGGSSGAQGGTISGNTVRNNGDGILLLDGAGYGGGLTISSNVATSNSGDGIRIMAVPPGTPTLGYPIYLIQNTATSNGMIGIESPGTVAPNDVIDGGGNVAGGNLGASQCLNVACALM